MENELIHLLLEHVDNVIDASKQIYIAGAKCSLNFPIYKKINLSKEDIEFLKIEIPKRDHGISTITFYGDNVYYLSISDPWSDADSNGEFYKPAMSKYECVINHLPTTN